MKKLSPAMETFILHWGEMGPKWGVNRSVAQVHALLYLSAEPLTAEEICETLSLARSNVSTSLRELQSWGIVRATRLLGDRRDHFSSLTDVWEMFRIVMDERKKREIDPTLRVLRECVDAAKRERAEVRQRLEGMLAFFETVDSWYGHVRNLPRSVLVRFLKLGRRMRSLLGISS